MYIFTQSRSDALLQLIFDFYLIKLIYVNIVKMHSYKPLGIVKIFRGIEGSHESAYQAILTMVFLIKTDFAGISSDSVIPLFSLIFSLWSLSSRFISLDEYNFPDMTFSIGLTCHDIKESDGIGDLWNLLNDGYIFHVVFRCLEVVLSILLLSLFWTQIGGFGFAISMMIVCTLVVISNFVLDWDLEGTWRNRVYTEFLQPILTVSVVFLCYWFQNRANEDTIFAKIITACVTFWLFVLRLGILFTLVLDNTSIKSTDSIYILFVLTCILYLIVSSMACVAGKYYDFDYDRASILDRLDFKRLETLCQIRSQNMINILFCRQLNLDIKFNDEYSEPIWQHIVDDDSFALKFYCDWYYSKNIKRNSKSGDTYIHDFLRLVEAKMTLNKMVYACMAIQIVID